MYPHIDLDSEERSYNKNRMNELEKLYDEQVEKVYKYFFIQSLDRHIAEDLTSHTFVQFIDKVSEKTVEKPKKYLYGIMRNVWAEHLRNKYKASLTSLDMIEDFEEHTESVVTKYESQNMRERALLYIEMLPDSQKRIAKMRFIEDMTIKEIATQLNKSVAYVKTTYFRSLRSLKKLVNSPETGGGEL